MVTEGSIGMLPNVGMRPLMAGDEELERDIGAMLRDQRRQEVGDRERELNLFRSPSAPPTVEGSLSAVGGLFGSIGDPKLAGNNAFSTEEELRSDPEYLSYYYSNVNLNPRLPPPVLSKEDWRFTQRLKAGGSGLGGIGDRRRVETVGGGSLFSSQPPGFNTQREEKGGKSQVREWLDKSDDGLIGLPGLGLTGRQKSFAEIVQEDLSHSTPASAHPSRPASRNLFDSVDAMDSAAAQLTQLQKEMASVTNVGGGVHGVGLAASDGFASTLGASLSRSTTPDPHLLARSPSPRLPPVGERIEKKNSNSSTSFRTNSGVSGSADLVAALSSMGLSENGVVDKSLPGPNRLKSPIHQDMEEHQNFFFDLPGGQSQVKHHAHRQNKRIGLDMKNVSPLTHGSMSSSSFLNIASSPDATNSGVSSLYQNLDSVNQAINGFNNGGYSMNPAVPSMLATQLGTSNLPPLFENAAVAASGIAGPAIDSGALRGGLSSGHNINGTAPELQNLNGIGYNAALQMALMDPLYLQFVRNSEYASQFSSGFNDSPIDNNYLGNSYMDLLGFQKSYLGGVHSPQKSQFGMSFMGKSGGVNHGYFGNPPVGLGMPFLGSPVLPGSPMGQGSPIRHSERNMRFNSGIRGLSGGMMSPWRSDSTSNMEESFASSLLEEFKSNKTKCFELSDIAGHVVEFSADQYGSRFIQQKLETATADEKNMVFQEIIPHALSLMTDVFGNYVIQKFFEHGSATQRRELANQLTGHVLTLSLQMYGCRVIQKAIEVVDLDQQTKMVAELDGNVMRCVRDQNGNHVIQKCIECIPQDAIQFIVSVFYDQVVTLSTHPYGCRVIQRVLEHCDDPKTQQIMMDEILSSVCMLAQDQYGNYVIQHVLEHGKPHERSAVIKKLAGQIVQMSQQKFASNVVEKCLAFGGPEERQLLVNEMLGTTDENEPLQAMMKDQFANYVVQKVLETCDDQQRELILTRIKVHLNALKKYTYGKHIVARVEKLVAAGEMSLRDMHRTLLRFDLLWDEQNDGAVFTLHKVCIDGIAKKVVVQLTEAKV